MYIVTRVKPGLPLLQRLLEEVAQQVLVNGEGVLEEVDNILLLGEQLIAQANLTAQVKNMTSCMYVCS